MELQNKLAILADAAKYDASCASSGSRKRDAVREAFALTAKEAEVLFWVAQGKINRDIADIVGSSPATVKKHMERIHAKLGVETRTAAAAMALGRLRQGQGV